MQKCLKPKPFLMASRWRVHWVQKEGLLHRVLWGKLPRFPTWSPLYHLSQFHPPVARSHQYCTCSGCKNYLDGDPIMPNLRLQNGTPWTRGWHHSGFLVVWIRPAGIHLLIAYELICKFITRKTIIIGKTWKRISTHVEHRHVHQLTRLDRIK